jgi:hypothetical protein
MFTVKVFKQVYRESLYDVDADTPAAAEIKVKRGEVECSASNEWDGSIIEVVTKESVTLTDVPEGRC